jgi:DNA-binding transcriptional LysR family regulator
MVNAAVSGCGLAFVTEDLAAPYLADGRLVQVMQDWCPKFPGLHAYYPSRRHSSRALGLVIETIRQQG